MADEVCEAAALIKNLAGNKMGTGLGGEEEGGGVRSGPGAARTILLFRIISARPPKQPLLFFHAA
jgi:hypothetical protein